jgi:triacylglycerol lipase
VVLVHGIGFRDGKEDPFHWGRIPSALRAWGAAVYFGRTRAWGGCDSNAGILQRNIEEILLKTRSERVNIIAHSKGGLDSRYMIWKYGSSSTAASLTTIASPHHGAEVADLLCRAGIFRTKLSRGLMSALEKFYGCRAPDIFKALEGLTPGRVKEFNETAGRDPGVYYQAIYSTLDRALEDPLFLYTHRYIRGISGNNDGLVSEASARWGENCRKIPGSLSHHDIIDMRRRTVRGIDVPGLYLDIVRGLAERGF